jgi:chromosome segregation ATPase
MALDSLKVLESKVESVLSRQSALGQERDRLQQELGEARAMIESMTGRLAEIERERAEIKSRVDGLLGRLDELGL